MKNLLFTSAAIICLFCSCGSSSSNNNYGTVPNPTPAPAAVQENVPSTVPQKLVSDTMPPQPAKVSQPAPNVTVQNNTKDLVVQPVTQTATPPVANGLNPAHGLPGHRCDISVGAPLNSAPAAAATTTTPQVQTITTPSPPAATNVAKPVKTAPGMNPPHGEPGHRCDISVGAPLNSKPAVTPSMVQPVTPSMQAEPAKKDSK